MESLPHLNRRRKVATNARPVTQADLVEYLRARELSRQNFLFCDLIIGRFVVGSNPIPESGRYELLVEELSRRQWVFDTVSGMLGKDLAKHVKSRLPVRLSRHMRFNVSPKPPRLEPLPRTTRLDQSLIEHLLGHGELCRAARQFQNDIYDRLELGASIAAGPVKATFVIAKIPKWSREAVASTIGEPLSHQVANAMSNRVVRRLVVFDNETKSRVGWHDRFYACHAHGSGS